MFKSSNDPYKISELKSYRCGEIKMKGFIS